MRIEKKNGKMKKDPKNEKICRFALANASVLLYNEENPEKIIIKG